MTWFVDEEYLISKREPDFAATKTGSNEWHDDCHGEVRIVVRQ